MAAATRSRSSSADASVQFGPWWRASSSMWATPRRQASSVAKVVFPAPLTPLTAIRRAIGPGYSGCMDPLAPFRPETRAWFERTFREPTPAQALGWPAIASGEHTLIQAPTGSGKTLAAFLHGIDRLAP